uniref:Enoyl-CoA hydratase n=1 Tax=Glossina brevipalpis TaxID=37001 RepID=A0A1A9WPG8_9MUSC
MFNFCRLSVKKLNLGVTCNFECNKKWFSFSPNLHFTAGDEKQEDNSILVEKDECITLIGINRPKKRNAINAQTAEKLSVALSNFEADNTSPIAVLYGEGGSFCSGYDIQDLQMQADKGSLDYLMRHEGSVGPTRRHISKPVICAVNGYCVAAGLELALMCDLRVMEDSAILGFINRRFGVPLSDGGTVRLGAMIGYARALDLLHTGRRVEAKEALNIGLVNRIVATGTALGQAVNLAFSIAKFPQASLLQDRNNLYANAYGRRSFRDAVQNEIMNTSKEVLKELKEGVERFKKSETKGAKTDGWHIKEKPLPDWEKEEIAQENKVKTKK